MASCSKFWLTIYSLLFFLPLHKGGSPMKCNEYLKDLRLETRMKFYNQQSPESELRSSQCNNSYLTQPNKRSKYPLVSTLPLTSEAMTRLKLKCSKWLGFRLHCLQTLISVLLPVYCKTSNEILFLSCLTILCGLCGFPRGSFPRGNELPRTKPCCSW